MSQNACRWCEGEIPHLTAKVYFAQHNNNDDKSGLFYYRMNRPVTLADVQAIFPNNPVIDIKYGSQGFIITAAILSNRSFNEFFCSTACAINLAHAAVREGYTRGKPEQ